MMADGVGGDFVSHNRSRVTRKSDSAAKRRRIACQHCRQSKVCVVNLVSSVYIFLRSSLEQLCPKINAIIGSLGAKALMMAVSLVGAAPNFVGPVYSTQSISA